VVGDFEGLARQDWRTCPESGWGRSGCCRSIPSPRRDNGYDITDYYGVDPQTGSLGDFVDFTHEAQKHGIRVPGGPGGEPHLGPAPWFKAAVKDPGRRTATGTSGRRRKPKDARRGWSSPGCRRSTWTYHPKAKAYYFHRFYDFQPDLNTRTTQVQEEMPRIMGFWLQLGVSGFRMDAVPFVIQKKGPIAGTRAVRHPAGPAELPAVAHRGRDHPRRGQRAARGGSQYFGDEATGCT
jgi:maltose alpha-D-glucosyltransferase/alpha-amylase